MQLRHCARYSIKSDFRTESDKIQTIERNDEGA